MEEGAGNNGVGGYKYTNKAALQRILLLVARDERACVYMLCNFEEKN